MQVDGPITNLRLLIPTSLLCEDGSDIEADSLCFWIEVQHKQTRRKIKKFPDIRALDELVQRQIQEVKLQFRSRLIQAAAKVFDSLSIEILECEFAKKLSTSTFDYYSRASDLVQHIRHFRDKMMVYSPSDALMCLTFSSSLKGVVPDWF